MTVLAENGRRKLWFGTIDKMEFLPTPNRGADVSPTGWNAGGELLSGGAYQMGSFNSAKNYQFEWPASSSRQAAQLMKSYADGTYGRGLIYFVDPLTYTTNVLPALWADPSMAISSESNTLVPGVTPSGIPTSANSDLRLPVRSAFYDLTATGISGPDYLDDSNSVFVPIPEGYSLGLGAIYSATGSAGVFYSPVFLGGSATGSARLDPVNAAGETLINAVVSPVPGQIGVRLWVGKTASGVASITLTAMTGRLLRTESSVISEVARNYSTNPNLMSDGTWVEVRRNKVLNPSAVLNTSDSGAFGSNMTVSRVTFAGESWYQVEATASTTSLGMYVGLGAAFTTGSRAAVSLEVRSTSGETFSGNFRTIAGGNVAANQRNMNITVNSTPQVVSTIVESAAEGALQNRVYVAMFGTFTTGQKIYFRKFLAGNQPGSFDGDTKPADFYQPEDVRVRWLGSPNASESVMEGQNVRGISAVNGVAIASTDDGAPAIRVIATSSTQPPAALIPVPETARSGGTLVATGTTSEARSIGISVLNPLASVSSPPAAGTYPLRLEYGSLTSTYLYSLSHGGLVGSADVWWSAVGFLSPGYTGPLFTGATPSTGEISYSWAGEPNSSESIATRTPNQLTKLLQGPWVGGQGHSGCRFVNYPTYVNQTGVDGGQVSYAASFREVGSWVMG